MVTALPISFRRFFALLATVSLLWMCGCASTPTSQVARTYPSSAQTAYTTATPGNVSPGVSAISRDPYNWPADAPQIYARSAIMIDAGNGEILFYKNPDNSGPVASTQKLLTALVVLDHGSLNDVVTIQRSDTYAEPSKLYLKTGDRYTRRDLLNAILVKSANDAAEALARDVAGSRVRFATLMNRKAAELGLRRSRFVNPHGLPASGQYSTAREMAKVAYYAYRDRTIRGIINQRAYDFRFADGRVRRLENTNKLLKQFRYANGMKTGYTHASGKCLISSASYRGCDLILVQLGSKSKYLWDDSETVLRWGLRKKGVMPDATAMVSE